MKHFALDALRTFKARGIKVPGDVAIVGFNDDAETRIATPPLTSVAIA
jgi:DNA-binding LacI/PurR family transcriptional regulator